VDKYLASADFDYLIKNQASSQASTRMPIPSRLSIAAQGLESQNKLSTRGCNKQFID
jgi:hypothetical protein